MNYLALLGGIVGLVAFILLTIALLRSTTEQSFAAFFLWALLDAIATVTTIIEGGNYWLALSNATGSAIITIVLVAKRQVSWTWIETMTSILVVICLVVWYTSGEQAGIVASSLAVLIAGIPQMVDTFRRPESTSSLPYVVFFIGNVMSLVAGRAWTIEERFYQCVSISLTIVILVFSLRRRAA
jgi:hypothetical protein